LGQLAAGVCRKKGCNTSRLPTGILIVTGFNSCLVVSSLAEDDTAVGGAAAFKDVTGDGAAAGVGAALVFLLLFETTPTLFMLPSDLKPFEQKKGY
jgi:hypothetical protein